jgi:cobalt-zinc-cadmium efflux system protein
LNETAAVSEHHHHHHGHGAHGHGHQQSGKAHVLGIALAVTMAYAFVEAVSGWMFGSLALLSDAGHMFSDAAALGLAWFAGWIAQRPPGARHSYGLARAEVVAAFINSLALILVVVWITVEAIQRLQQPATVNGLGVMLVAFLGLLINLAVVLILSRAERNLNLRAALLHVASDVIGSVAALLAGAVIYATGWQPIDPILSFVIAVLILVSTIGLLREALHVLMEGVPRNVKLEDVGRHLARVPGVLAVHDLHIWNISSGRMAMSAHVDLDSLEQWPTILDESRRMLSERYGIDHVTLQPEIAGQPGQGARHVIRIMTRR